MVVKEQPCGECEGTGVGEDEAGKLIECPDCDGTGEICPNCFEPWQSCMGDCLDIADAGD